MMLPSLGLGPRDFPLRRLLSCLVPFLTECLNHERGRSPGEECSFEGKVPRLRRRGELTKGVTNGEKRERGGQGAWELIKIVGGEGAGGRLIHWLKEPQREAEWREGGAAPIRMRQVD